MTQTDNTPLVALPIYARDEWDRLLEVVADPESLPATWREWNDQVVSKEIVRLAEAGREFEGVGVGIDELVAWCEGQGRPVDAAARADYAAHKLAQGDPWQSYLRRRIAERGAGPWILDELDEVEELEDLIDPDEDKVVALAWFRREEWPRLREVSDDADDVLEETWEEWVREARRTVERMEALEVVVEMVDVGVDELVAWCREQGRPVDAPARAGFAADKLRRAEQEREEPTADETWGGPNLGDAQKGVAVGLAWYRKDEWPRLLEVSVDSDDLQASWEEWVREARSTFVRMVSDGLDVERVEVDVDELVAWCREQGRPVDASARTQFAADQLGREDAGRRRFRVVGSSESG